MHDRLRARLVDAEYSRDGGKARGRRMSSTYRRLFMATLAAAIITVLAVGVLLGARLAERSTVEPVTKPHATSQAFVGYRAVIDRDYRAIEASVTGSTVCSPRSSCIASNLKLKTAVETLIQDIDSTPTPPPLAPVAANLKEAAQQLLQGLVATINALQDPKIDYNQVSTPAVLETNLDVAVATVDCWPAQAVPAINSFGPNGYRCAAKPS